MLRFVAYLIAVTWLVFGGYGGNSRVVVAKLVNAVVMRAGASREMGPSNAFAIFGNFPFDLIYFPAKFSDVNFTLRKDVSIDQPSPIEPRRDGIIIKKRYGLPNGAGIQNNSWPDRTSGTEFPRGGFVIGQGKLFFGQLFFLLDGSNSGDYSNSWSVPSIPPMGSCLDEGCWFDALIDLAVCVGISLSILVIVMKARCTE